MFERAIVIVLDSVGVGELPDAGLYGDQGSDTVGHIADRVRLRVPTLASLGLPLVARMPGVPAPEPGDTVGAFGRMAERSAGKDSVTGHWELMGVVLDQPFPTFPQGFPRPLIEAFEARIGRGSLGNVVASGTAILDALGPDHMTSGWPIVYTSADSVFQIAAHEDVVPVSELYRWCEVAYDLAVRGYGLGRVIARPFIGTVGAFTRTARRHDYAMPPTGITLLDRLAAQRTRITCIGKIHDLFAGRATGTVEPTPDDEAGMDRVEAALQAQPDGFIFANLVDFDTRFGHRNDVEGYAANLERFDLRLARLLPQLRDDDVLVVTADHGNDPSTPSTDHSREYVPLLVTGPRVRAGVNLGTRPTFADLGQTLAQVFDAEPLAHGRSFLQEILAS